MTKSRTQAKEKAEHIPEIVTFSMYSALGILGLFVLIEAILIGYWLTMPSVTEPLVVEHQDLQNIRLELEVMYRQELREAKEMYAGTEIQDRGLDFHQELRNYLVDMKVPPSYRYYHLSLVVLLDELIVAEQQSIEDYNFLEKERQLAVLMNKYQ